MKGSVIIYFLTIFLLTTTTVAWAQPQLMAQVEVEQLMRNSFSLRSLLADYAPSDVRLKMRAASPAPASVPAPAHQLEHEPQQPAMAQLPAMPSPAGGV